MFFHDLRARRLLQLVVLFSCILENNFIFKGWFCGYFMNSAWQQTYYWEDGYRFIPQDGFPLKINEKQYHEAVKILEEQIPYIPTEENLNGQDYFKKREFLFGDCLARLNAVSQLHNGRNTKIIRLYSGSVTSLDNLSEKLNLPFPQWNLRNAD